MFPDSPQLTIQKSIDGAIEEGDTIALTCASDANPPPTHFTWVKDGGLGNGSDTLVLKSISLGEEGSYRCKAENGIGNEAMSEPVMIHVDANGEL